MLKFQTIVVITFELAAKSPISTHSRQIKLYCSLVQKRPVYITTEIQDKKQSRKSFIMTSVKTYLQALKTQLDNLIKVDCMLGQVTSRGLPFEFSDESLGVSLYY